MQNHSKSKIEELYASFSKKDMEKLTYWMLCPAFNTNKVLLSIHHYFNMIISQRLDLNKKELYQIIYGANSHYSDLKLRVYISKLTQLIEKFILIENIDTVPSTSFAVLQQYYKSNQLTKNASAYYKTKPTMTFSSYEDKLLFDYQYYTLKLNFIFADSGFVQEEFVSLYEENKLAQNKYTSFILIKSICDYLNFSQKYNYQRDISMEEKQIELLLLDRTCYSVIYNAYLSVYLLLKHGDINEYNYLKFKLLEGHLEIYDQNCKAIITHLQNYCIKMVNSGQSVFLQDLFDIYHFGLKFYTKKGDLNSANFRNIVYCALQIGKIDWAENFIESYYTFVVEEEQFNAYNFNYARVFFEKKDYSKSMKQLLKVTYEDSFYASSARILLIKCYFELNDTLPLLSCCSSLNQFFHRNKSFTAQRIENNLHFIKFVKLIQNHRLDGNKKYFFNLKQKITNSTTVEKEWLLQKVDLLH